MIGCMSVSHATVTEVALTALAKGQNRDPFAVLGPHEDVSGPRARYSHVPAGRPAVDVRLPDGGLVPMSRRDPPGVFEAVVGTNVRDYRLRVDLRRRPRRGVRRSLSIRPRAHRLRSASARRRDALSVRSKSSARTGIDHRIDDGRALRRVGAKRRAREPDRRLQRLGRPRPRDATSRCRMVSGRFSFPICRTANATSLKSAPVRALC